MKRTQFVVVGVMVLACLAMPATDVMAAKPPKPTPTPTPTPTPPAPCTTCTIAYVHVNQTTDQRSLMVMEEDGSNATALSTWPKGAQICEPAWSPDGRWIAFNSRDYARSHKAINVISYDGSESAEITTRCSFEGGETRARIFGPSWQPVDHDGNGMYWLVYADGLSPDDYTCSPGRVLWAIEVRLGSPVSVGRRVPLTFPDPVDPWTYDTPVWSGDGSHLAAVLYPGEAAEMREVAVFDVQFTGDGLPYLDNPGVLTFSQPVVYPGEPSWAHDPSSNRLIATAIPYPVGGWDLWLCDVEHDNLNNGEHTCGSNGWTNLTLDFDSWVNGPRFSNTDDRIVVLKGGSQPRAPYWEIWVGTLEPFAGQAIKTGHAQTYVMQPDWRPWP